MGTFVGHAIPGSFFFLFGIWWTLNIFRDFYKSKRKNGKPFLSQTWYPGPFCKGFPLEITLKITVVTLGMTGEFMTEVLNGFYRFTNNGQHMIMYFFFGVNGAMELMKHYNVMVPDGIDYTSALLALGVEGFTFLNHLHGRKNMDVQVHIFLFCIIVACMISILIEIQYRHCPIPSLARSYFIILQGTWFYQIGFVLYPPFGMQHWDLTNHEQLMIMSLVFTLHLAAVFVLMTILAVCVWTYMKKFHLLDEINYHIVPSDPIQTSTLVPLNGHCYKNSMESENEAV